MSDTIHIVCLDSPSPPNYGGAIDMFYKIKSLSEIGKSIILHYFDYNPSRKTKEVEKYCSSIYSYKRKTFFRSLPFSHPFIVRSRINKDLIQRLNKDEHPILLEGLHCSGIVPFLQNKKRILLRMHNNEAAYYGQLAVAEKSLLKKTYYLQESRLLHRYQQQFDKAIKLACLSQTDMQQFEQEYHFRDLSLIPLFLPWQDVRSKEGKGDYCLYHGNLTVVENEEAAAWLMENVFSLLHIPFVIAGRNIPTRLFAKAKKYPHVRLVNNPPDDELNALISDAHIHVLPSANSTGVKLKLLNALLNGRFCITNKNGATGVQIETGMTVQNEAEEWRTAITNLMNKEFTAEEKDERKKILFLYNNRQNALKLNAQW